jgi:RimJ/RimL family protein N-acetyltransferase
MIGKQRFPRPGHWGRRGAGRVLRLADFFLFLRLVLQVVTCSFTLGYL